VFQPGGRSHSRVSGVSISGYSDLSVMILCVLLQVKSSAYEIN
jgi:hypothetical protein